MALVTIHPFPARMAPDIALTQFQTLPQGATIMDPMVGSGTVIRAGIDQGLKAIGFDTDPLAVLMASVWTTPVDVEAICASVREVASEAEALDSDTIRLPWIDEDPPTKEFIDFWFGPKQRSDLRKLSWFLSQMTGPVANALRLALSRIIVTKDSGASLGRDISHSRPHRVMLDNEFPVLREFVRSADRISQRLQAQPPKGRAEVHLGDARNLERIANQSIEAVVTSPPYLNAIDYIRGHKLSLVWLGYQVGTLASIRAGNIGAERAPDSGADTVHVSALVSAMGSLDALPVKFRKMADRYAADMAKTLAEISRVLTPGGQLTLVIGNSCLRGVQIDNAAAVTKAAELANLRLTGRHERELPPSRRYLPPPASQSGSDMSKRMRTEVVLRFMR